jgi:MoaA/NifB/PqqE/SkfB family radical SAM enzyme
MSPEPTSPRERAMRHNEDVVRRLLAPLHEPGPSGVAMIQNIEADSAEPSVYFDYVVASAKVRVQLTNVDRSKKAFLHTQSLTVLYQTDTGIHLPPAVLTSLGRLGQLLSRRDAGGVVFKTPGGERGGRNPLMIYAANENRQHTWSREKFDRTIDGIAARGGGLTTVVAVVSQPCEMQCVFCPTVDRDKARTDWAEKGDRPQLDDLLHQLGRAREVGATSVDLGGNDVLRFSLILELLEGLGALGYSQIIVQTTGLGLSDRAFAEGVARSPATDLCIPIYGASAAAHEAITQTPGSFERVCRGVEHVLSLGRPAIRLHTIALASTLARLEGLIDFCRDRFGLSLNVTPLRPNWLGERAHLPDATSLTDLRAVIERHPRAFAEEFPLCQIPPELARARVDRLRGPHAELRRTNLFDLGMSGDEHARVLFERAPQKPAPCEACAVRACCDGVTGAYLERFGSGELSPYLQEP